MLFSSVLIFSFLHGVVLGEKDLGERRKVHPQDGSNIGNQEEIPHFYLRPRPSAIQNLVHQQTEKPNTKPPTLPPPSNTNPQVGRKHTIVDLIDTDEEYDENPHTAPPLKSRTHQVSSIDDKRRCMITYNLQDKTTDESHARMLKQEINKLQDLVQVLRDQQYILNILNDVDGKSTDPKDAIEHSLIKHLKKLNKSENATEAETKINDGPSTIINRNHRDESEIVHLKHEVENLKELLNKTAKTPDLDQKLKTQEKEIVLLKDLVDKLANQNETQTQPPITPTVTTDKTPTTTPLTQESSKRESTKSDEDISQVLQQLNKLENKLAKFVALKNADKEETVGTSLTQINPDETLGATPFFIPRKMEIKPNNINQRFPGLKNHTRKAPTPHLRANTNSEIDNLLELLSENEKSDNLELPGDDLADPSEVNIKKLLKSLDNHADEEDKVQTRLEELEKLVNRKKTSSSIEEQLKKLERKLKDSDLKSKTIDDEDDDPKEQLRKLKEHVRKLNKKGKIESKSHADDDDDVESELKSLQKAIKGLQTKDETDDFEDPEEKDFEVMLNKFISTGGKKKLTHAQIQSIRKRLLAMKGINNSGDEESSEPVYGVGELISYDGGNTFENAPPGYGHTAHHHGSNGYVNALHPGKHLAGHGYSYNHHGNSNGGSSYGNIGGGFGYPPVNSGYGNAQSYGVPNGGLSYENGNSGFSYPSGSYGATGLGYGGGSTGGNYGSGLTYGNTNSALNYGTSGAYGTPATSLGYGGGAAAVNYGSTNSGLNYGGLGAGGHYGSSTSGVGYGGGAPVGNYASSINGLGYGAGTAGGNYGSSISGLGYGSGSVGGNYGSATAGLAYGGSSTGGNYGPPAPGISYGAGVPAGNYGVTNTAPGYGGTAPAGNYGSPSPALGYGGTAPAGNYGSTAPALGYGGGVAGGNYGPSNSGLGYATAGSTAGYAGTAANSGLGYAGANSKIGYGVHGTGLGYGSTSPAAVNYGTGAPSYGNQIGYTGASGQSSVNSHMPGYGGTNGVMGHVSSAGYGTPTGYSNPGNTGSTTVNSSPYGVATNPTYVSGSTPYATVANTGSTYDAQPATSHPPDLAPSNYGTNNYHPELVSNADYANLPTANTQQAVDPNAYSNNLVPHIDPNQYGQQGVANYEQSNHFFPAASPYASPSGQVNAEGYQEGAAANAQNPSQPYANPQQNPNDYTEAKVTDLKHQIYDLQNIISTFNKPEYLQNPEDKETVYKLDKQINDLRSIINTLTQDYPNGATATYQNPPPQQYGPQPAPQLSPPPPPSPIPVPAPAPPTEYQPSNAQPPVNPSVYTQAPSSNGYAQAANAQPSPPVNGYQTNTATYSAPPVTPPKPEYQPTTRSHHTHKREICNYEESPIKFIKKPHSITKRDSSNGEMDALQSITSLFGKALLDPTSDSNGIATPPRFLQPNLLNDVTRRIESIQKQLEFQPRVNQPNYYSYTQPDTTRLKLFKKNDVKIDIFDKIFDKVIDKIISKIGVAIPKLVELFFGGNDFQEYMSGGYNGANSGYGNNGYSLENSFRGFGMSGFIPMIILKILSKVQYFVSYLQRYKFFKTFLIPALVLLLVAGSIIFLVWWLQPNDDYNYNKHIEYQGGMNYAQGGGNYYRQANTVKTNVTPYPMYGQRMNNYNTVVDTNKHIN